MKSIGWDTSFHLNGKFPLLDNSIFPSLNAAKAFVSDSTSSAIAGTIIGVDDPSNSNETGLYEIFNDSGELALRKLVSEGTLASYKTKIDSLITDLSGNYSSELAELAAQQAKQLETLRDEMFSPDNDTTPVTRTMMLQVGADSTNYRFSTNEIGSKDTDGVVFNSSDKSLSFLSGTLYHFSITDDLGKPRTWSIPDSSYIELDGTETSLGKYMHLQDYINKGESLWVYLKVPKTEKQGKWFLSPTKYGCILDDTQSPGEGISLGDTNYYYLLYGYCGVTSSEIPFFEPVYGNTWIKGSTIYTGKVQTMDGYSALDLDNNTLKLGNDFYYADGQVVVGNPDTGAFVFHKHGDDTALHVGTMTKDSDGTESWNGMTFANGELTIGKYEEKLKEMQTQLDKEVSTWYGQGIPLPYKESEDKNIVESVASELVASYNETLTTDENGVKMFNLGPDPEPLPRHINDIYINSITGVGYRLVVSNWGIEGQQVYWLQLSQWDLQNILNQLNGVNTEVGNIKKALDIADGSTVIGDKFIETMMLRIGADSTNYTLSETSTSGNRMQNLQWIEHNDQIILIAKKGETLHHSTYYWVNDSNVKSYDWKTPTTRNPIFSLENTVTTPQYLYIKCPKASNAALWFATDTPKSLQDDSHYYFPFGTVVNPSTKTLVEVRGNTKIVGDRIITGKLESNTGNSFFDLDNGQFALGVDQNNPTDLDKAAFSFDGNKVHIGNTFDFEKEAQDLDITSEFSLEGVNKSNQIKTVPIIEIVNTEEGALYKIKSFNAKIYNSSNNTQVSDYPKLAFILASNDIKYGQSGIEQWFSSIERVIVPGEVFQGKDGYSIYICWGETHENLYEIIDGVGFDSLGDQDIENIFNSIFSKENQAGVYTNTELRITNLYIKYYKEDPLFPMLSSTDIKGGLVLTNILGVKDSKGAVTAGISGINNENNKTAFWAGSTIDNKENAPVKLTFDGINSQVGPLKITSDSTIIAEKSGSDYQCIIDITNDPCINIKNGNSNLKLISSDIDTDLGTIYNTQSSWASGVISSGTYMQVGSPKTSLILKQGKINLSKIYEETSGQYNHTVNSYTTFPVPTTFQFIGKVSNSNNKFGLVADINLYVNGEKRVTLASINKPINVWQNRQYGFDELDSNRAAFQVTFQASSTSPQIQLDDFGKSYSIQLDIKHLSRWWANTSSSGTIYIKNGTKNDDALSEWQIVLVSTSNLQLNCTYSAQLKTNGSGSIGVTFPQGMVGAQGFRFVNGKNLFAASVNKTNMTVVLGNLPTDGSATPLGIDSNGRLCRLK